MELFCGQCGEPVRAGNYSLYNGHGNGSLSTTVSGGSLEVAASNVTVEGLTFTTMSPSGIQVDGGAAGTGIYNNVFTSSDAGVVVGGSAAISQNTFSLNTVGVRVSAGGSASLDGNTFGTSVNADIATDVQIDAGAAGTTLGATANNTFGAATFIINASSLEVNAANNEFVTAANGTINPAAETNLSNLYALENQITDGLDSAGPGLVRIKSGNVYVTQASGSIQRGVDLATAGIRCMCRRGRLPRRSRSASP